MNSNRAGILFVLSAPSGAGKTTLLEGLRKHERFVYSVSCTTRNPRPGEIDGRDYHFITPDDFAGRLGREEFIEHAEVHGKYYGTLKKPVVDWLNEGRDVLIEIDTQGAAQIRACNDPLIRRSFVDVFVMPPGVDEIRARLQRRGTESAEQIELRIRNAEHEMRSWPLYRYTVLSGTPEEDLSRLRAIMHAEACRGERLRLEVEQPATP